MAVGLIHIGNIAVLWLSEEGIDPRSVKEAEHSGYDHDDGERLDQGSKGWVIGDGIKYHHDDGAKQREERREIGTGTLLEHRQSPPRSVRVIGQRTQHHEEIGIGSKGDVARNRIIVALIFSPKLQIIVINGGSPSVRAAPSIPRKRAPRWRQISATSPSASSP